ncbi:hypothetical protein [Streptomyces sp. NPDC096030]|uniref:hypothetical protein n=1 Tax=Streptomyces sp. NPDC096030 TaxID=3155423 RepID=UPI003333F075
MKAGECRRTAGRMQRAGRASVTALLAGALAAGAVHAGAGVAEAAPAIAYEFPVYNASQEYTLYLRSADAVQTPTSCSGWAGPPPAYSNDPDYDQPAAVVPPKTLVTTRVWLMAGSCNKVHAKYDVFDRRGDFAGSFDTYMYLTLIGQSATECRTDAGSCLASPDWTGPGQKPNTIVFS